jgi:excisionase family DNA binding protein
MIKRGVAMELLTVKETAELLRVSTVTVRRYIASGKLAAVRVGRNIRIRRDDAERVIEPTESSIDPKFIAEAKASYFSDSPTDIAENHEKYLAEAYADTHEDDETPFTNPDGDTTLTPREWLLKNDPLFWTLPGGAHEGEPEYIEATEALLAEARAKNSGSGKPLTFDSPIWDLVGEINDDGPDDMAKDHDKYLAKAYADMHEEEAVEPVVIDVDPRFADKSDEWLLENHPLLKLAGVFEDREGKTDIAENHDKYLAEAYADLHEE